MPLKHFFLERYDASFTNALEEFHASVVDWRTPSCTVQDGRDALAIALACDESRKTGTGIKLNWE